MADVVIGVSTWRTDDVWDRLCTVRTTPLTNFYGITVALERVFAIFFAISEPGVDLFVAVRVSLQRENLVWYCLHVIVTSSRRAYFDGIAVALELP